MAPRSPRPPDTVPVYLEVGAKRVFAGAIDWPGWCRSGRDEESALEALAAYAPRYRRALGGSRLGFPAARALELSVVERLKGDASTDFGAPGAAPKADAAPVGDAELRRLEAVLRACWRTFDAAVDAAEGRRLAVGPRGGGRSLDKIVEHVAGADAGYLASLGWKLQKPEGSGESSELERVRRAIPDGLAASAHGEIPSRGPRGGIRWTPRYHVRRAAWHVLDHAWEIEDRST
jgi:hypothetical protein